MKRTKPYHTVLYRTCWAALARDNLVSSEHPLSSTETTPYYTTPYSTTTHHSTPYHTIPQHTTLSHTIPYHTLPYNNAPHQTLSPIPDTKVSCHSAYHTTPQYNTLRYHPTPHRPVIISYLLGGLCARHSGF